MWVVLLANISGKSCRNKMVDFRDKKRVESTKAVINVDAGLPVGKYLLQLTVVDEAGNRSRPAGIRLEVFKPFIIRDPVMIDPVRPILIGTLRPDIRLN